MIVEERKCDSCYANECDCCDYPCKNCIEQVGKKGIDNYATETDMENNYAP